MFGNVLARVAETVGAWQDPVVRHQRALTRAREAVRRRITVAAGLTGATAILLPYGGGVGLPDAGWAAAAGASVASAVWAGRRLAELRAHVPPPARPRRLSSARPAVDRLGRAVASLQALLVRLGSAGEDTAMEAVAAERSLRELAARVDAVEGALMVSPAEAHAGLDEAQATLLGRLDEGTQAYELLVAAAAQCVAATVEGPGDAFASRRLQEATERLHGLAAGLHEVRGVGRAHRAG
ncbi:MAG: hypothetical protein DLM59_16395 [Pseudonocardiales bacterium]|nr:MAG: hypothetical protein DLM59_16395 [Pseudonocardiales bacterium]